MTTNDPAGEEPPVTTADQPADVEVPRDVYVRIQTDLLVIGDSIVTDRHHASNGNYEADDPQNQIGGIIPAFSLSGWLRHGMEAVVQKRGHTVCHPGESDANFRKADVYERDLEAGYHPKGECLENGDECIVLDVFGGFANRPGTLLRRPITFSPVRSVVAYPRGEAEGHYRRLNRNVVSRAPENDREPLRNTEVDAIANLDGCWHLTFRERDPAYVGLLVEAIRYLSTHRTDFDHQLGGARNFGAGIVDCEVLNPLYSDAELKRVFDRGRGTTTRMADKDDEWTTRYRPAFERALHDRLEGEA